MKSSSGFSFLAILLSVLLTFPVLVSAQQQDPVYSDAEIDQMLAPIALYPDVLLSQILIASTYPLEIVAAARWRHDQQNLSGQAAVDATADKNWDPSVRALLAFPRVLDQMDKDLDWTQRLGEAFLHQEAEVMARVQVLRERADAAGSLDGLEQVHVSRDAGTIIIDPPSPQLIYVPYYDPRLIYGNWWWPAYQPYYWAPPSGYQLGVGFLWGSGVRLSSDFFFSTVYWPNRQVVIVPFYRPFFRSPGDYSRLGGARAWQPGPRRPGMIYRGNTWRTPAQQPGRVPQRDSVLRNQGVPVPPRVGGGYEQRQSAPPVSSPERSSILRGAPSSGQRDSQGSEPAQTQNPPPRQNGRNGKGSGKESGRSSGQRDSILR